MAFGFHFGPFRKHGQKEIEFALGDSARGAFRIAEFRVGGEGFDLYYYGPRAFHGNGERASGKGSVFRIREFEPRIGEVFQSFLRHAEKGDFVRRAEPVFKRAENAVVFVAAAFQKEDGIHQMFERFRSGNRAVLGNVPDEYYGFPGALGEFHSRFRGGADERNRTGGLGKASRSENAYRVEDDESGRIAFERGEHVFDERSREKADIGIGDSQTDGAVRNLRGVFFGRGVERGFSAVREPIGDLDGEGGFSDSRFSGKENERTRNDSAAEEIVQFRRSHRNSAVRFGFFVGNRRDGEGFSLCGRLCGRAFFRFVRSFDERVPFAACGAFSRPFRLGVGTIGTTEHACRQKG